jgi:uncharacterized protein (TIGR03437 family)
MRSPLRYSFILLFALLWLSGGVTLPRLPRAEAAQCPLFAFTPNTLAGAAVGLAYSQSISAVGGQTPFTYSLASGPLPPGMLFGSNGRLGGTPTAAGNYSFQVRVTDANNCTATRTYSLSVQCPDLTLTPATLPDGRVGLPYAQNLMAAGGTAPYNFSLLLGSLPTGLSLLANGAITGAPNASGRFSFTVRVRDANNCSVNRGYSIEVGTSCPPITVNPATLPNATTGLAYARTVTATGGQSPYLFALVAGALPAGLNLSATTGEISGRPTATSETASFTLRAVDANGCTGQRMYTIQVACPTITINPASLPAGTEGTAYRQTFTAVGGTAPYSFRTLTGTLPPAFTLDANGTLSGAPHSRGSYTFTLRATDANGCGGERSYTLVLNNQVCPTLTLNPATLPAGRVGTAYSQTFSTTGGTAPYSYDWLPTLPPGLSLNANGSLSGTPTTAGSYSFTVGVNDSNSCNVQRNYTVVINAACPAITINPAGILSGRVGQAYSWSFNATGGAAPYTYSITSALPAGLTFTAPNSITGTPTAAGDYTVTARATDANGCTGERAYTLMITNVACPTITLNPAALPAGRTGIAYNQTLSASGGAAPYAFSLASGALPSGLSLAANGALTGTPSATGSYAFTARVTDANGCAGERPYTIVINDNTDCAVVTVAPATLPAATTNAAYNQSFTATGGTAPYSFSLTSGLLPSGLTLLSNGTLSGAVTTAGSYNFTVRANDARGCQGSRAYTLLVADAVVVSVSAASYAASVPLATESIIAAFGAHLATSTQVATALPLPTSLGGVSVKVKDSANVERLAPLFFVSAGQINYQLPLGTALGTASVTVTNGATSLSEAASGLVASGAIEVATVAPGLFAANANGQGAAAAVALRVKADGSQSYEAVAVYDATLNRFVTTPIDLGPAGEQVFLVLYGTGVRFRSGLSAVSCAIGGEAGAVLYAGEAPGFAGLDQLNVGLPRTLAGRGEVDVIVSVEGKTANTVRVAIR